MPPATRRHAGCTDRTAQGAPKRRAPGRPDAWRPRVRRRTSSRSSRCAGRSSTHSPPQPSSVHAVDRVSFSIEEGEVLGLAGESGSGQVHDGPAPPASDRADLRCRGVPGTKRHELLRARAGAPAGEGADRLPGPQLVPQPAHERGPGHHAPPADPRHRHAGGAQGAGAGPHGEGGSLPGRVPVPEVPPPALRRPEPARRAGAGAGDPAGLPRGGRAHRDGRRLRARPHPPAHAPAQAGHGPHVPFHHARPCHGEVPLRQDRGHVPGPDRGARLA